MKWYSHGYWRGRIITGGPAAFAFASSGIEWIGLIVSENAANRYVRPFASR